MPLVNGFEATRRIKSRQPETKVIILSVHSEIAYEQAAYENGADAFIVKKRLATDLLPTLWRLINPQRQATRSTSVLVVDDNPDFLKLTAEFLRQHEEVRLLGCAKGAASGIKMPWS